MIWEFWKTSLLTKFPVNWPSLCGEVCSGRLPLEMSLFRKLLILAISSYLPTYLPSCFKFWKFSQMSTITAQKWSFLLRISSVKMTKSAGNCGKKFLKENFIFVQCIILVLQLRISSGSCKFPIPWFEKSKASQSWKPQKKAWAWIVPSSCLKH